MPDSGNLPQNHGERLAALSEQVKMFSSMVPKIEKIYELSFRGHAQNEEIIRRLESGDRQFQDLAKANQMHHGRITSLEGTIAGRDGLPGLVKQVIDLSADVGTLRSAHSNHKAQLRLAAGLASGVTAAMTVLAALGTFVMGFWHIGGKP